MNEEELIEHLTNLRLLLEDRFRKIEYRITRLEGNKRVALPKWMKK